MLEGKEIIYHENRYYRHTHIIALLNARTAWSKTKIPYENRLK